ncbi:hypothetical protein [Mesorhizobium sp. ANAO-SY3R2]|uniref:hypothetical protein n=1 Tax=Mesorhizobium sp. ANAO-SY3R2 TaxID=3166644 RepID=UPI00366C0A64
MSNGRFKVYRSLPEEIAMIGKIVVAASVVAAFSMPAFAAEYWVAKDAATHKCEVVEKKPDGKKMMEVGKAAHATKAEAEKAMKAAADCK